MATPYSDVYDKFKNKLLKDPNFFMYKNITEAEAEDLVNEKCKILLGEAISELLLKCVPDVNFYNKDDILEIFNFDVSELEKELIASLMKQKYLEEDELMLKALGTRFTSKEIDKFSPAQERTTFMAMLKEIKEENNAKISAYSMRDRITGQFKSVIGD
jgi:hypothetical protein